MTNAPAPPPLRALVVHESMFGCTEKIARAVARGLTAAGFAVDLQEVGSLTGEGVPDVDLLVVGAPTHAFSLSRPSTRRDAVRQGARPSAASVGLREWLAALEERTSAEGRPAAAFDTRVSRVRYLPLAAATRAARLLTRMGYRIVVRPKGFIVADLRGPVAAGEEDRAERWAQRLGEVVTPASGR